MNATAVAGTKNGTQSLMRALLMTFTGGAGFGVFWLVAEIVKRNPAAAGELVKVLGSWGPLFGIAVTLIFVGARGGARVVDVLERNASAQQSLADAVQEIAKKSDAGAMEQRSLLSYVGSQQEKIRGTLDDMTRTQERLSQDVNRALDTMQAALTRIELEKSNAAGAGANST